MTVFWLSTGVNGFLILILTEKYLFLGNRTLSPPYKTQTEEATKNDDQGVGREMLCVSSCTAINTDFFRVQEEEKGRGWW